VLGRSIGGPGKFQGQGPGLKSGQRAVGVKKRKAGKEGKANLPWGYPQRCVNHLPRVGGQTVGAPLIRGAKGDPKTTKRHTTVCQKFTWEEIT